MNSLIHNASLIAVLAPAIGGLIAGLLGKQIGPRGAHSVTILGVGVSFLAALFLLKVMLFDHAPVYNADVYTWALSGSFKFNVGFLVDNLTAMMLTTVTFVSLLVHIYSIGYMHDDPGYPRFFSYMSMFTFAMISLVISNNFLQLFFGWEGVGVVSYLLIGFWFKKDSAAAGGMKAFLVNRVGDFGFLIGIALVLRYFGSLDYATVFKMAPSMADISISVIPNMSWSLMTVAAIFLFIGAMGKSAQMPLHIWLPESMEGPTPISALIHAATMVTAGIYMVCRLSPIYELSETALSVVLIIGATSALLTGIIGVVMNDIKRVVAYSTLSQLGYMIAATGVSAFSAGIFHLTTHAAFKALLFLGAGSVIMAMHHEQDMRKMGNLRKYMPITFVTYLIGTLALTAVPPFAGFYSKDAIIEAVHHSHIAGATYAYVCLMLGAFVTALYSFRSLFMVFFTEERMDAKTKSHLKESPWVVWVPLVILAVPSAILGWILVGPMLYQNPDLLSNALTVAPQYKHLAQEFDGPFIEMLQSIFHPPFWFSMAGIATAWWCYIKRPETPQMITEKFSWVYRALMNKYGFDAFNDLVFVKGTKRLSEFFYRFTDMKIIDGIFVNGSAKTVGRSSKVVRRIQTGMIYHYALVMVLGLMAMLLWLWVSRHYNIG